MSRVALKAFVVLSCILGFSVTARADCIVGGLEAQGEVANSVAVVQAMSGVSSQNTKRIAFPNGDDAAVEALKTALHGCTGKAYFVGHQGTLGKDMVKKAVDAIDGITDAYIYVCNCKGGIAGKVKQCIDEVIWPADIAGVKGFLIKRAPWDGMKYESSSADLAAAGAALLEKLKLIKGCPHALEQMNSTKETHLDVERRYKEANRPSSGALKEELELAIKAKASAKAAYDLCKDLKAPATLAILTGFGQPGANTLTRVNADGVVH